jgi:hypothetical protein
MRRCQVLKKARVLSKSAGVLVISALVFSIFGCVAAIPVAYKYIKDNKQYSAKAELPAPVEKVYTAAVSLAEEKDLKILKKDDAKYMIEVTDGKQTASLTAVSVSSEKTQITVTASIPEAQEKKTEEKELALRIMDRVCERLGVTYTIVEE